MALDESKGDVYQLGLDNEGFPASDIRFSLHYNGKFTHHHNHLIYFSYIDRLALAYLCSGQLHLVSFIHSEETCKDLGYKV